MAWTMGLKYWHLPIYFLGIFIGVVQAQKPGELRGTILHFQNRQPLPHVLLKIENTTYATVSDSNGHFRFPDLSAGTYSLVGIKEGFYSFISDPITILPGKVVSVHFEMIPGNPQEYLLFSIGEITVTVSKDLLPESPETSHQISEGEIEHLQATNLGDLLDLIPGVDRKNQPGLQQHTQLALRGARENSTIEQAEIFGTKIEIDGIPLSNNANLHGGSLVGYVAQVPATAGKGIDLRLIPADNIQSVEIISGLPSVEYGDVTGGVVKVKTRSGIQPLRIKVKTNPGTREWTIGGGFELGKHTVLNLNWNNAYSLRDLRLEGDEVYRTSIQARLHHRWMNDRLILSEKLQWLKMFEDYSVKNDPLATLSYNHDYTILGGVQASFRTQHMGQVSLNAYFHYVNRNSRLSKLEFIDPTYVTNRMTTGTQPAVLITRRYRWQVDTKGKELSAGIKATWKLRYLTFYGVHNILAGLQYQFDGNFGAGKQFDPLHPPFGTVGRRPRRFDDVPPLQQFSVFAEDRITFNWKRPLTLMAGLRVEWYTPYWQGGVLKAHQGTFFNPRLGLKWTLTSSWQWRLSYGQSSKMPSLYQLHPDPVYVDILEYGIAGSDTIPLITTYRLPVDNPDLKGYRQVKLEIGTDWQVGKAGFSLTAFWQHTRGIPYSVSLPYIRRVYFWGA